MMLVIAGRNLMNHLSARRRAGTYWKGSCADGAPFSPARFHFAALKLLHQRADGTPSVNLPPTAEFISFIPRRHKTHRRSLGFLMSNGALSSRVSATGVERAAPFTLKRLLEHLMLNVTNETVWTLPGSHEAPAALGDRSLWMWTLTGCSVLL